MFDYAILGLGKSGRAVLEFLVRSEPRARILASDAGPSATFGSEFIHRFPGVVFEFGGHSDRVFKARLVIKSPGLSPLFPIFGRLKKSGAILTSEIGLAFQKFSSRPRFIVGITGTNGKTTTTHLLGHLLQAGGGKTVVAGNIGYPLIGRIADIDENTTVALELSSYQIEDSEGLDLDCAILLNITPDHLDHHGNWENYVASKEKIFKFVRQDGWDIVNFDNPAAKKARRGPSLKRLFFSARQVLREGAWIERKDIRCEFRVASGELKAEFRTCPNLIGEHNLYNQMAAILASLRAGVSPIQIQGVLDNYKPPSHRLEILGETAGIMFVNDSKATNVDSVMVALKALGPVADERHGKIHLFLGGRDKGFPYKPIGEHKAFLAGVYAFGESGEKIKKDLGAELAVQMLPDLKSALDAATAKAGKGDILLLSPACASFDQFDDFEHRGDYFRALFNSCLPPPDYV